MPVPEGDVSQPSDSSDAPSQSEPSEYPASTSSRATRGLVDGLERLAELYEIGALTEEEFKAAKGRLLD